MHIPPHKAIIKAFPRNCKSRGGKFTKENVSVFQQLPARSGNFSKMSIFFLFSVPTHQNSRRKADALRRLFFVTEPSGRVGEGLPSASGSGMEGSETQIEKHHGRKAIVYGRQGAGCRRKRIRCVLRRLPVKGSYRACSSHQRV